MKKLKRIVIVLLLLVVIAAVAAYFYIDTLAKTGIERGATYALGVDTTVDGVSVGIFSGQFGMDGLNVANPQGYTAPHFLDLGRGELDVTLGQLMKEKIQVTRLSFKDVDVHLEKAGGKANYAVIMENLEKLEAKDDETIEDESDTQKKFVFDLIEIENITVHVNLTPELQGLSPAVGDLTRLDVSIPRLTLKNVGSDSEQGALIAEVADVVIKAILQAAVAKGGLPPDMLADLQGRLAQLENIDKLGMEMAGQAIKDVQKKIGSEIDKITKDKAKDLLKDNGKDLLKDAGKGIGDLFNKDKK